MLQCLILIKKCALAFTQHYRLWAPHHSETEQSVLSAEQGRCDGSSPPSRTEIDGINSCTLGGRKSCPLTVSVMITLSLVKRNIEEARFLHAALMWEQLLKGKECDFFWVTVWCCFITLWQRLSCTRVLGHCSLELDVLVCLTTPVRTSCSASRSLQLYMCSVTPSQMEQNTSLTRSYLHSTNEATFVLTIVKNSNVRKTI